MAFLVPSSAMSQYLLMLSQNRNSMYYLLFTSSHLRGLGIIKSLHNIKEYKSQCNGGPLSIPEGEPHQRTQPSAHCPLCDVHGVRQQRGQSGCWMSRLLLTPTNCQPGTANLPSSLCFPAADNGGRDRNKKPTTPPPQY